LYCTKRQIVQLATEIKGTSWQRQYKEEEEEGPSRKHQMQ